MRTLPDLPALAAFLLGGADGRLPASESAARVHAAFAAFAKQRRLGPELSASDRLAEAALPREVLRSFQVDRESARLAGIARDASVARAGNALFAAGLSAIPYKGLAVVALTHGDASRRPMGDIDLIVPRSSRAASRKALLDAGFEATTADTPLHDVLRDPRSKGPSHPHGIALEVHVDVFPRPHPFRLDLDGCFDRSRPWLPGLMLPATGDALLLSAFHLAVYETDSRKTWVDLRDVSLLSRAGLGAWAGSFPEELAARAAEWDIAPIVAPIVERSLAWAGGPDVVAAAFRPSPRTTWRRSMFLSASLAELDGTFASEATPVSRQIPVRLASAAWDESFLGAVGFGLRKVFGRAGLLPRLARYARAAWAALRRS